ncbi:hypothetical protein PC121_g14216 [Phytophthora cactorum]|nr:hypothetical protein PC120_g12345 [Phytophthora cactorum]KAG3058759.1 hypothetical protein PC121_g14216 [Phytophthora cactorum]KAG4053166.1 hypothetical protein PC123_g11674 [Phytophthora cactorum]
MRVLSILELMLSNFDCCTYPLVIHVRESEILVHHKNHPLVCISSLLHLLYKEVACIAYSSVNVWLSKHHLDNRLRLQFWGWRGKEGRNGHGYHRNRDE